MNPLVHVALVDSIRMRQDKVVVRPVHQVAGLEKREANPLLTVFLFVATAPSLLLALCHVSSVQEIATPLSPLRMVSNSAQAVQKICSHSSQGQMTPRSVRKNALLGIILPQAWLPVLLAQSITSSLLLVKGSASNANRERRLLELGL